MHVPCQTSPVSAAVPCDELQPVRDRLALPESALPASPRAQHQFPFKAPQAFLQRIVPADPGDPLLRQIWPAPEEEEDTPGYRADPVGDDAAITAPGLLRKYHGRALLIATGSCAIHCRYCFRRHFPYQEHHAVDQAWEPALRAIAADTSITEVILSGGDPLTLSPRRLRQLLHALAAIGHVQRLRVHTRVPVVAPERLTQEYDALFAHHPRPVVIVIHANHPRELDDTVRDALLRLRGTGLTLLNQSVLLRGVNDEVDVLAQLSARLFACGVLPYYLHQLDPVTGAAHFAVSDNDACALTAALRARLPGYLVPQLVREIAGAAAKQPLPA